MTDGPAVAPGLRITKDRLLDGRVILCQPKQGYRAAIDPVFLAAAIPVKPGETVLDLGAGVGAASLCLARRVDDCRLVGIEADATLIGIARSNIDSNRLAGRIVIHDGDVRMPLPGLEPDSFDHVMANPPYLPAGAATPSPIALKSRANIAGDAALGAWTRCAIAMVRRKGTITFIYRADRLEHLLAELQGQVGEIVVYPLWPGTGKAAKRIIVRARKGVASPTQIMSGLVLHEADGRYTEVAQSILRSGAPLPIGTPPR